MQVNHSSIFPLISSDASINHEAKGLLSNNVAKLNNKIVNGYHYGYDVGYVNAQLMRLE